MGLMNWFRRKPTEEIFPEIIPLPAVREARVNLQLCLEVQVDERGLIATVKSGDQVRVDFADLVAVSVRTSDEGPWLDDVFWVLTTPDRWLQIPQGVSGEADLFESLLKLPGFNKEAMITAMSCVENREFFCWSNNTSN